MELDADIIYNYRPHYLCFCLGLCMKWSIHRHVCILFSLEQLITILCFHLIIREVQISLPVPLPLPLPLRGHYQSDAFDIPD
jgi:hypothetical protein